MTQDELKQIRTIVQEAVSPLSERMGTLGEKVGVLDERIGTLGERIETLELKMEQSFDSLDKKIDTLRAETTDVLTGITAGSDEHDQRIKRLESRVGLPHAE